MLCAFSVYQAVVPLMRYLEKEMKYMNENLVQENFNRSVTYSLCVYNLVQEISNGFVRFAHPAS